MASEIGSTPPRTDRSDISRRSALAVVAGGLAALATGAFGLVAGFLSNSLGRGGARPWIGIGPAEGLDAGSFQKHVIHVAREHGWRRESVPKILYIKDLYPADPIALLSTCSHLGCSVSWEEESRRFRCPCHGGLYDAEGAVIGGPPPRPLTRLEVKIEDEICYVRLPGNGGREA